MLILFASETGSSKEFAIRFAQEYSSTLPVNDYQIMDMDTYYDKMLSDNRWPSCLNEEKTIIYFISTCGDGECPTNMRKFWKAILSTNLMPLKSHNTKSAVFSFGDSSYPKYNWAAKKLYRRIEQLGAIFITKSRIDCDDRSIRMGQEGGYLDGRREILASFSSFATTPLKPSFSVIRKAVDTSTGTSAVQHAFNAKLLQNEKLSTFRDVRNLFIQLSSPPNPKPEPGDLIRIFPHNTDEAVEEFLSHLGWNGKESVVVSINSPVGCLIHIPAPTTTLFDLFKYSLDLNTPPRPLFFLKLALLTDDPLYKERLTELYEDRDSFDSYCFRPWRRSPLECLKDFPMIADIGEKLLVEDLMDSLMPMRFRDYSISDFIEGDKIQLTISLLKFLAPKAPSPRYGTASRWMEHMDAGIGMQTSIVSNCKRWTDILMKKKDVIIFATGAGISPMLFMINYLFREWGCDLPFKLYLFVGCRAVGGDGVGGDLLHYERFHHLIGEGFPLSLYALGSRDHLFLEEDKDVYQVKKIIAKTDSSRLHIDNLILFKASLLEEVLLNDPTIFIGGNPKIPKLISQTPCFAEKWRKLRVILECW